MKLKLLEGSEGFSLESEVPENRRKEFVIPEFADIIVETNEKGEICGFDIDLWHGDISYIDELISYFESHPVPGRYTVEELGLYDVPFVEVLKAVKKRYEEKQKVSV